MAKYEIKHSCGCVETVNIYGTNVHDERERKAAWLASQPCLDCQRKAEVTEAEIWETKNGIIAPLDGSEKQVAWARTIRHNVLSAEIVSHIKGELKAGFYGWASKKSTAWWIENRNIVATSLIEDYAKTIMPR